MKVFVVAVIGPVIANQFGWVAAEVGRQPWIVWGELRTSDALSVSVPAEHVLISLVMFGLIYLMLFIVWLYVLDRKIRIGPVEELAAVPAESQGLLAAAAAMTDKSGASMTDARADADETKDQE
jgi:cytochrome d ubiquinol oxidase subunit I